MGDEKEADDVAQPSSRITVFGDLLGLGSGTKALLDNISKAIGILYKPRAIKNDGTARADVRAYEISRIATAVADAELTLTEAELALQNKAGARLRRVEMQRQQNIDNVIVRTSQLIETDEHRDEPNSIHPDWMQKYMDYVKDVSDERVSRIWAEILARQSTGSRRGVSLMTLDSLRLMEPNHASLFEQFARKFLSFHRCLPFTWDGNRRQSIATGPTSLSGKIDSFDDFSALSELGFIDTIRTAAIEEGALWFFPRFSLRFHQRENSKSSFDEFRFTFRGEELARVVLQLDKSKEAMPIKSIAMASGTEYEYLTEALQAQTLGDWFGYLWERGYQIEVGEIGKQVLQSGFDVVQ